MRKSLALVLAVFLLAAGMAGCGESSQTVTETTIELKKDGSVVHTIVEDFSAEPYYDIGKLQTMIQTACDEYNAGKQTGTVTLEEITEETGNGVWTVKMLYPDASAYAGFNQSALFVGTVKEAYSAGYDMNVTLVSLQDDTQTIGKDDILGMGEKHMAIVREAVDVRVWNKVLYASGDVLPIGDGRTVMVGDSEALTYIIFE